MVLTSICLGSVFLFGSSVLGSFFQDDWFTLYISRVNNYLSFLQFFVPRSDVIYYRPLGMQVYFFIMQNIFGLNATAFHFMNFVVHFLNIILIYITAKRISLSTYIAATTATFYGLASYHFITFYWSSTFPFLLGQTWYLLCILTYLSYRQTHRRSFFLVSFLLFFIGLLTSEFLVTLPIILLLSEIIFHGKKASYLEPVILAVALVPYFFLRFFISRVPLDESYAPRLTAIVTTLRTYLFWILNWPEEISNQFVGPLSLNQDFSKDFSELVSLLAFSSIVLIISLAFAYLRMVKSKAQSRCFLFGILWFSITLSPLLFFPEHKFPYYLAIPSMGLYFSWAVLLSGFVTKHRDRLLSQRNVTMILIILWFISSLASTRFSQLTHWAAKRSRITKVLLGEIKERHPSVKSNSIFFFPRDDLLKITLNDQLAIRIIYNDQSLNSSYTEGKDEAREKFVPQNDQELIERYPFSLVP